MLAESVDSPPPLRTSGTFFESVTSSAIARIVRACLLPPSPSTLSELGRVIPVGTRFLSFVVCRRVKFDLLKFCLRLSEWQNYVS